jgi:methylated-DNA-protein-cysteine methyltransferase-like protein
MTKRPFLDTPFAKKVLKIIRTIPKGKVATYGQIAALAGKPQCPRQVGMILRFCETDTVPWQRVLGAGGRIAFPKKNKNFKLQRRLLEMEGVPFEGAQVNLEKCGWKKKPRRKRGQPFLFS